MPSTKVRYVLFCRECDEGFPKPLPMPFESAEDRGRWAAAHTKGTGHAKWFVIEQDDETGAVL